MASSGFKYFKKLRAEIILRSVFFASGAQKLNRSLDGVTSVNTMKPARPSPPSRRTDPAGIYLQDWLLENSVFTEFTAFLTPGTEWGIEEAQNTEKRSLMSI